MHNNNNNAGNSFTSKCNRPLLREEKEAGWVGGQHLTRGPAVFMTCWGGREKKYVYLSTYREEKW